MKELIKKNKNNFILILVIGFGIYFFIFFKNDASKIIGSIQHIHIIYIVYVLIIFFMYTALEAGVLHLFAVNKVKGFHYRDSFQLNLSTQFFNNITPFASGGQPFQVYYLNTRGIKVKDATSIVLMNFITYSIAFDIVGLFCLIYKYNYFHQVLNHSSFLSFNNASFLLIIGFGVNLFMTGITMILAFSKRLYHLLIEVIWLKVIKWRIFRRFKLENRTDKIKETINDFNREIKELNQHKRLWFFAVLMHISRIILIYLIPLFIFIALGIDTHGMEMNLIIGAFFVAMVMSYIPTPGASGGAEGLFHLIYFALLVNEDHAIIVAALLLWRFITYYLYLLFGFISLLSMKYQKNLEVLNYSLESEE